MPTEGFKASQGFIYEVEILNSYRCKRNELGSDCFDALEADA